MNNIEDDEHITQIQDSVFESEVILKYQVYSGLFLNLPFKDIDQSGARLSIFTSRCLSGLADGHSPLQIVEDYLSRINIPENRKIELLFKFLQFIERQVVLFDAIEDASFDKLNDLSGSGTIDSLLGTISQVEHISYEQLLDLLKYYKVRIVLTAHPTQFYPDRVLSIISQLSDAIRHNDLVRSKKLFLQMGLTKFSNKTKPTPIDEANSLIWYLERVFYDNVAKIQAKLPGENINFELGFWPGGDRDGNPFVTHDVTLAVARHLRSSILNLYYRDIDNLRYRLTFDGVSDLVLLILDKIKQDQYINSGELIADLESIIRQLNQDYHGLFIDEVQNILLKIKLFGFYFARIDIRQNSHIHQEIISQLFKIHDIHNDYRSLADADKISLLKSNFKNTKLLISDKHNELINELFNTIRAIHKVQLLNEQKSIERYIISNTESVTNIFEVMFFLNIYNEYLKLNSITNLVKLEIVPLFETIDDLMNAQSIMEILYLDDIYQMHLSNCQNQQTIMLGFSDGTKDGGYLMANFAIYMAKKQLTQLSRRFNIKVIFFDGRGGPPARGGGSTNDFYRSLGDQVASSEIQLTIQGQTISSKFGTDDGLTFNLEQLFTSGIIGKIFQNSQSTISKQQELLIEKLANIAYEYYVELRDDPLFIDYLQEVTPLKYLSDTNVGSRPVRRSQNTDFKLSDLRAIPFVSAWTQMRQNILGFYGLGYAISRLITHDAKLADDLKKLYRDCLFFKTLINNSMQSLEKSNFIITQYLLDDLKYRTFWLKIKTEADNTRDMLLLVSGHETLLENDSAKSESINLREKIILPLLVIQQYAMMKLRQNNDNDKTIYEKLIKKSLAANINANRNSV